MTVLTIREIIPGSFVCVSESRDHDVPMALFNNYVHHAELLLPLRDGIMVNVSVTHPDAVGFESSTLNPDDFPDGLYTGMVPLLDEPGFSDDDGPYYSAIWMQVPTGKRAIQL